MSGGVKGLNSTQGTNRFKFQKRSDRVKQVSFDVVHKTKLPDTLDIGRKLPETGSRGCHFQDALEGRKNLDTASVFKRFYYQVWPFCQSMPELIHHLPKVVTMLEDSIRSVERENLPSFLELMSVLARDMQDDLFPYFHRLFGAVVGVIDRIAKDVQNKPGSQPLDPELGGKIFECLSHMLKFQSKSVIKDPNCIRQYYGPLLGNSMVFVREFAAKTFVVVLRKFPYKLISSHWKKVLKSVVSNFMRFSSAEGVVVSHLEVLPLEGGAPHGVIPKRLNDLFDGMTQLLFYLAKGVKGFSHTYAETVLAVAFEEFSCFQRSLVEDASKVLLVTNVKKESTKKKIDQGKEGAAISTEGICSALVDSIILNPVETVFVSGHIVTRFLRSLFRYLTPSNLGDLWSWVLSLAESCVSAVNLSANSIVLAELNKKGADLTSLRTALEIACMNAMQILLFAVSHSNGRGIADPKLKEIVRPKLSLVLTKYLKIVFPGKSSLFAEFSTARLRNVSVRLLAAIWKAYPRDSAFVNYIQDFLPLILSSHVPLVELREFISILSPLVTDLPLIVSQRQLLQPLLKSVLAIRENDESISGCALWMAPLLSLLYSIKDVRSRVHVDPVSKRHVRLEKKAKEVEERFHSDDDGSEEDEESEDKESDNAYSDNDDDGAEEENSTSNNNFVDDLSSVLVLSESDPAFVMLNDCVIDLITICDISMSIISDSIQSSDSSHQLALALLTLHWISICRAEVLALSKTFASNAAKLTKLIGKQMSSISATPSYPFVVRVLCQLSHVNNEFCSKMLVSDCMVILVDKLIEDPLSMSRLSALIACIDFFSMRTDIADSSLLLSTLLGETKANQLLAAMIRASCTPSYWIRVCILRIVSHLPLVSNRIKADMSEENQEKEEKKVEIDIPALCLEASALPASLNSEREYARKVGAVEAFIRLGLASRDAICLAASFSLGVLSYKFKPFWQPAVNVLVAAVDNTPQEDQDVVWKLILDVLSKASKTSPPDESEVDNQDSLGDEGRKDKRPFHEILTGCLHELSMLDNGADQVPVEVARSVVFPFLYYHPEEHHTMHVADLRVDLDARVDYNTHYMTLWSVFKACPNLTMQRSKIVVPMFLSFVRNQFYRKFTEEIEIPDLIRMGILLSHPLLEQGAYDHSIRDENEETFPDLPPNALRKRLDMFLQVFGSVSSPRQLYQHQLLYNFFAMLVTKSDASTARLAMDCILNYKSASIVPFKAVFKNILDDSSIRRELVTFDPSIEGGAIDSIQRPEMVAMLIKVLIGRFTAKPKGGRASRDQSMSCRIAILTFLSVMPKIELSHFMYLIFRSIVPKVLLIQRAKSIWLKESATAKKVIKLEKDQSSVDIPDMTWYQEVNEIIRNLVVGDVKSVPTERQIGFLHLLENLIRILGLLLVDHSNLIGKLVVLMLTATTEVRGLEDSDKRIENEIDAEDEDENEENGDTKKSSKKNISDAMKIRKLCVLRLADIVNQFHKSDSFDYLSKPSVIWTTLDWLVEALPSSLIAGSKAPSMLKFIHALAKHPETVHFVAENSAVVDAVVKSASRKCEHDAVVAIVDILSNLLNYKNGVALKPKLELLIASFALKFAGPDIDISTGHLTLSQLRIYVTSSFKLELNLFCRIAEELFHQKDVKLGGLAVANFATLLLGMVRTYTVSRKSRVEEEWLLNLLRVYRALLPRMDDIKHHVTFISRLFGPTYQSSALLNAYPVRDLLCDIYSDLASHPSCKGLLSASAKAIADLTRMDATIFELRDFSTCMPVFQGLCGDDKNTRYTWSSILGPQNCKNPRDSSYCVAVLFETLRCMHDEEQGVRSAALSSLKRLVDDTISWVSDVSGSPWLDTLKSALLPGLHLGLQFSSDGVKKGFVSLLSHIIRRFAVAENISVADKVIFHADLMVFIHEDPDQDVFENISHLQLHRRSKALTKLSKMLRIRDTRVSSIAQDDKDEGVIEEHSNVELSISTFMKVLVPLALHPLESDEFLKSEHLPLWQDSAQLLGVISSRLPWSQYYGVVRSALKLLDRGKPEKEKVLLNSLCNVLDSFHFDLAAEQIPCPPSNDDGSQEESDDADIEAPEKPKEGDVVKQDVMEINTNSEAGKIANIVINSLIPWIRVFLFKEEIDENEKKSKIVRPQVAVALSKLIKTFKEPLVSIDKKNALFNNLVITVVATLKNVNNMKAREQARDSLAMMVTTMGIEYLHVIVQELNHSLVEGYQRHVKNFSVRSIITDVLNGYQPPVDAPSISIQQGAEISKDDIVRPAFDRCIPMIMTAVIDDLAGLTNEDMNVEGAVRSKIKEAKGNKANEILEIIARCLLFRPSYALAAVHDPISVSSVHAVVLPLLRCLDGDADAINLDSATSTAIRHGPDDALARVNRVSEALKSVAQGLSKNTSVKAQELLIFIHAALQPFVIKIVKEHKEQRRVRGKIITEDAEDAANIDNFEDELMNMLPSYLVEDNVDEEPLAVFANISQTVSNKTKGAGSSAGGGYSAMKPAMWLPFDAKNIDSQRIALERRDLEQRSNVTVQDGANAPKRTGYGRMKRKADGSVSTDSITIAGVKFCLTLLNSSIKRDILDGKKDEQTRSIVAPLLPLLGECLCLPGASTVATLALRSICSMLGWGVEVDTAFSRLIARRVLRSIAVSGALVSADNELVQGYLKGLTSLFMLYANQKDIDAENEAFKKLMVEQNDAVQADMFGATQNAKLPLPLADIRSLISLITVSIMSVSSANQNASFQLIKALIDAKIVVPEMYDLIKKLTDQIVLSHRKNVREIASSSIVTFLINYPLGTKRLTEHVKQLINNCSYEYEAGRDAALSVLLTVVKLFPLPVLHDISNMVFFPMVQSAVSDEFSSCRAKAAEVITALARRIDVDTFSSYQDFSMKWLSASGKGNGTDEVLTAETLLLVKTGALVAGQLVLARPDLCKKGTRVAELVRHVYLKMLFLLSRSVNKFQDQIVFDNNDGNEGDGNGGGHENWSVMYALLLLLDRMYSSIPSTVDYAITHVSVSQSAGLKRMSLMEILLETLLYPHAWIRAVSCRILLHYFGRRDSSKGKTGLIVSSDGMEFLVEPGTLFGIGRRLCVLLNQAMVPENILEPAINCFVFVVLALLNTENSIDNTVERRIRTKTEKKEANVSHGAADHNDSDGSGADDGDSDNEDLVKSEDEDDHDGENIEDEGSVQDDDSSEAPDNQVASDARVSGLRWLMQRLRGVGIDTRGSRRMNVLKVFYRLLQLNLPVEFYSTYMNVFIETAMRARLSQDKSEGNAGVSALKEIASEILDALEKYVGSSVFIGAYGDIQTRIRATKLARKRALASEAISNPRAFAQRKAQHNERKKQSKKRKNAQFATMKGKKRQRIRN